MSARLIACCGWAACLLTVASLSAEVVRFEIHVREPFAGGAAFGDAGRYERIIGKVFYRLDPRLRQNQAIVDLDLAPRNADGFVEYSADLFILAPAHPEMGNGALLYDVNNRGNKLALSMFNDVGGNDPSTLEHSGNGFLFRQGFTVVWSGWDGELLPGDGRLQLFAPSAVGATGTITGLVRCEIVPTDNVARMVVNWANHGSYRPTEAGLQTATLTHRLRPDDDRVPIPRDQWRIEITEISSAPSQLPKVELELAAGLERGHIYELIYEAQDPLVMGTGFTAVRDLVSALKYGGGEHNPLAAPARSPFRAAYGFGVSQSGRFLREFLYWGLNEDEQGRKVFDGVIPHVAGGGLGSFNHRFAQPTRHAAQHDHADYPPDRFPFSYEDQCDPLSGECDGILRRCRQFDCAPVVLHTQSSAEYWTRSGSLPHTDALGEVDAAPGEGVRFFTFGGTQHGPSGHPPNRGFGQNLMNPADYRPLLRALLLALDRHVRDGAPLPRSVVPRIADGTLVDWSRSATGFPSIPQVRFPELIRQPPLLDFGPDWQTRRRIALQPPRIVGRYRVLVPRCGPDGNELGCLLPPEVAVPVGTYTGWNLRRADMGPENQLISLAGSFIPFAATKDERQQSGDPRLSLQERYGTQGEYLRQLTAACRGLESLGLLLAEDSERILARQEERTAALFAVGSR
jgi:hypothetical protein